MNDLKQALGRCCIFNAAAAQGLNFTCGACRQEWNHEDGAWRRAVERELSRAPEIQPDRVLTVSLAR